MWAPCYMGLPHGRTCASTTAAASPQHLSISGNAGPCQALPGMCVTGVSGVPLPAQVPCDKGPAMPCPLLTGPGPAPASSALEMQCHVVQCLGFYWYRLGSV